MLNEVTPRKHQKLTEAEFSLVKKLMFPLTPHINTSYIKSVRLVLVEGRPIENAVKAVVGEDAPDTTRRKVQRNLKTWRLNLELVKALKEYNFEYLNMKKAA